MNEHKIVKRENSRVNEGGTKSNDQGRRIEITFALCKYMCFIYRQGNLSETQKKKLRKKRKPNERRDEEKLSSSISLVHTLFH